MKVADAADFHRAAQVFQGAGARFLDPDPMSKLFYGLTNESEGGVDLCNGLNAISDQIQAVAEQIKGLKADLETVKKQLKADVDALKVQIAALHPSAVSQIRQRTQSPSPGLPH